MQKKCRIVNPECITRTALCGLLLVANIKAQELPEVPAEMAADQVTPVETDEPKDASSEEKKVESSGEASDQGSSSQDDAQPGQEAETSLKEKGVPGDAVSASEPMQDRQQDVKEADKNAPKEAKKGITTIDLDEGNWLLKRKALERTMNTIEEVNTLFNKIMEQRMSFLVKRNKVDRDFDLFAKQSGFDVGDLNQMSAAHIERMEEMRKNAGQLSEPERELLREMEQKSKEIKQWQDELSRITDLDASLDDALMQVEQEIDQANGYQAQSWRNFQAIKKVLNDEKAEELALRTEGLLSNMKDIYAYLTGQLSSYFNQTAQSIQESMNKVAAKISEFKSNEETLKAGLEKFLMLDRQEKQKEDAEEKAKLEEAQKKLKELQEQQKRESQSMLHRIFQMISYPFMWCWEKIIVLFS